MERKIVPGAAEFESAGLYDPTAGDAPERLAVLEYLVGVGASIDDLLAVRPDELGSVGSKIGLWGDTEWLAIDEVARRAGVDRSLIGRAWRAAGFPEPDPDPDLRAFTSRDVEMLGVIRGGIEFFGEDVTMQLLRVLGSAAGRVADASISAFTVNILPKTFADDAPDLALARANVESLMLVDGLTSGFDNMLRRYIQRGYRTFDETTATPEVDLVQRSVGFADLVESTEWAQLLDLPALSRAMTDFDAIASEIVVQHGGRVVKLIGDEVMFVAGDGLTAARIALALIDAFAGHEALPPVRAGIATGAVVARDGDYSGAVVSLAARAVKIATPSTLLVDRATREELSGAPGLILGGPSAQSLKGFAEPVELWPVSPAG